MDFTDAELRLARWHAEGREVERIRQAQAREREERDPEAPRDPAPLAALDRVAHDVNRLSLEHERGERVYELVGHMVRPGAGVYQRHCQLLQEALDTGWKDAGWTHTTMDFLDACCYLLRFILRNSYLRHHQDHYEGYRPGGAFRAVFDLHRLQETAKGIAISAAKAKAEAAAMAAAAKAEAAEPCPLCRTAICQHQAEAVTMRVEAQAKVVAAARRLLRQIDNLTAETMHNEEVYILGYTPEDAGPRDLRELACILAAYSYRFNDLVHCDFIEFDNQPRKRGRPGDDLLQETTMEAIKLGLQPARFAELLIQHGDEKLSRETLMERLKQARKQARKGG